MNSPRRTEMNKLRSIQSELTAVCDRIATRLPTQRGHLAALVSARKWQLTTLHKLRPQVLTQQSLNDAARQLRMEVGVFEYSAKQQGELLTRALFQLDDILSHGDAEIKEARKALVLSIQAELERADEVKMSAAKLKAFTERVIARFPPAAVDETEEMKDVEDAVEAPKEAEAKTLPTSAAEEEEVTAPVTSPVGDAGNGSQLLALFDEDSEDEPQQPEDANETMESGSDSEEEQKEEEDEGEEEHEEVQDDDGEGEDEQEEEQEEQVDVRSLPVWRPYYQIQQCVDGVHLQANLHGVDPRHIRVEAMPHTGVVRITGFKIPTQKDLLLSRFSGSPTFGRFEIVESFPANQFRFDRASQQITQDGRLQVRLPFNIVQRPRVVRRVSPFQPFGLPVW